MFRPLKRDSDRSLVSLLTIAIVPGLLAASFCFLGCQRVERQDEAQTQGGQAGTQAAAADPVARGKYLVTVGGCNDCHTPWKMGEKGPEPDMARLLSGHPQDVALPPPPASEGPWIWHGAGVMTAFAGPWGVSYGMNLTPDEETGIGIWTEEIFVKAMRTGQHWQGNRPILPPMPWQNIATMTDEDLSAVFAYLKSIPPVKNKVPEAVLAAPPEGAPPAGS